MRTRTGKELRELRKEAGLTMAGVCRLTGISRSTWEKWELGRSYPSELSFAWLKLYLFVRDCVVNSDCPKGIFFKEKLEEVYDYPDEYDEMIEEDGDDGT